MARDNAACNKAIRKAWERERQLVLEGKGTRNWTAEQREQLITKGKVYDADGKAFIGQHMKSVSGYPEFQGDVNNIQFLSKEEHLEAHKGNWQNVTNWYYDPETKEFYDFEVYDYDKFPPIITLCTFEKISEDPPVDKAKADEKVMPDKKEEEVTTSPQVSSENVKTDTLKSKIEPSKKQGIFSKLGGTVKTFLTDKALPYILEHPIETVEFILGTVKFGNAIKNAVSKDSTSESNVGIVSSNNSPSSTNTTTAFNKSAAEESVDDIFTGEEDFNSICSSKGTPKRPHDRVGYWGDRWKIDENGNRYKSPSRISPTTIHPEQYNDDSKTK